MRILSFGVGAIRIEDVAVRDGRYTVEEGMLHFDPGGGVPPSATLRCGRTGDEIVSGALRLISQFRGKVTSPPAGHWETELGPTQARTSWDLRSDGTIHIEATQQVRDAKARASHGSIEFDSGEEWKYRREHGHLFITSGGVTTEYQPRAFR